MAPKCTAHTDCLESPTDLMYCDEEGSCEHVRYCCAIHDSIDGICPGECLAGESLKELQQTGAAPPPGGPLN